MKSHFKYEKSADRACKVATTTAKAVVVGISLALLSGCAGLRLDERPSKPALPQMTPGSKIGLAFSGGGLRSGAVSLGALQGLNGSSNQLSRFDYISVISGGGYPVYGVLYQMIRNEDATLDELLSESGKFVSNAEAEAGFIKNADIYGALPLIPFWSFLAFHQQYGAAQPTYGAKIHRTFAGGRLFWRPSLRKAANVKTRGLPIPIFGTSASFATGSPKRGYTYNFGDFFELSPGLSGSPNIGYFTNALDKMELIDAAAASGGAIDTPQGDWQLPAMLKSVNFGLGNSFSAPTNEHDRVRFYLSDGGFIENLGILPLLRRGCTDILVFDNSDDSSLFDAWFNFERRLAREEPSWSVSQPLSSTNGAPPSLFKGDHWKLPSHIWKATLKNGDRKVRVVLVKLGINQDRLEEYPPDVSKFARADWKGQAPGCDEKSGLSRHCSFPVEATTRQSFATNEFRAYRLLGKWMAEQAIPHFP